MRTNRWFCRNETNPRNRRILEDDKGIGVRTGMVFLVAASQGISLSIFERSDRATDAPHPLPRVVLTVAQHMV